MSSSYRPENINDIDGEMSALLGGFNLAKPKNFVPVYEISETVLTVKTSSGNSIFANREDIQELVDSVLSPELAQEAQTTKEFEKELHKKAEIVQFAEPVVKAFQEKREEVQNEREENIEFQQTQQSQEPATQTQVVFKEEDGSTTQITRTVYKIKDVYGRAIPFPQLVKHLQAGIDQGLDLTFPETLDYYLQTTLPVDQYEQLKVHYSDRSKIGTPKKRPSTDNETSEHTKGILEKFKKHLNELLGK